MQALQKGIRLASFDIEPATALPDPGRVSLPLLWGETPLVRVGEPVLLGQKIADGGGDIVPLHASLSGTVAAVAPRTCHDGRRYPCVVVDSDGRGQWDPSVLPRPLLDELTDEQLVVALCEAGIRQPDGVPLAAAIVGAPQPLQTLLISAVDQEPFLHAEDAAAAFDGERVLTGIRLLQRLLKPRQTIVAVTAGQKAALRAIARWEGRDLRVCCCADRYPVSQPLLLAAMAAELEPGKSLREAGIAVVCATAAAAASRAVYEGKPVVSQLVSVDWGLGRAAFLAPLGTSVGAVVQAAGQAAGPVILGGLLTGGRLENLTVPLSKGMTGLCLLPEKPPVRSTACIRCGSCAKVCPVGLLPYLAEPRTASQNWGLCLRCGACQYSCPAGRPLLGAIGRHGREVACVG